MAASSNATGPYRFIRPEPQALWAPRAGRVGRRRRVRSADRTRKAAAAGNFAARSREAVGPALAGGRVPRPMHPLPPPRLLPRHGAAMGAGCGRGWATLDARRSTCSATPASAPRDGGDAARGDPCRCLEEVGRQAREETPRCPAWRTGRSAGWSTTPPSSPRARCGAAALRRDHPRSAQIRPRARPARCGGSRRACPA